MTRPSASICVAFAMAFSPGSTAQVAHAQLLPDKAITSVGDWTISTAMYGVGCVAHLAYDGEEHELSISGEAQNDLVLLVTVDRDRFETPLDGSSDDTSDIEVALARKRWGSAEAYGYRGTSGIILRVNTDFLDHFKSSKLLKVTERGREKLSIPLGDSTAATDALFACFDEQ